MNDTFWGDVMAHHLGDLPKLNEISTDRFREWRVQTALDALAKSMRYLPPNAFETDIAEGLMLVALINLADVLKQLKRLGRAVDIKIPRSCFAVDFNGDEDVTELFRRVRGAACHPESNDGIDGPNIIRQVIQDDPIDGARWIIYGAYKFEIEAHFRGAATAAIEQLRKPYR